MGCHSSKMPTSPLINQPPTNLAANVPLRSPLSFDSLKEVTSCLLEMNQEVVRVILDCKQEIRKNPELFHLVKDYFDKGLHTLNFCNALDNSLKSAQISLLILHRALHHFEEDGGKKHEKIKYELKRFKESGDLFTKEFLEVFQPVRQHQLSMLYKLSHKNKKIDKSSQLSCIIFVSASAVLLISSLVAAIVAPPPITAAIFAACSAMGKWFDSMWNNYREAIKKEKMIINALEAGTSGGSDIMDGIRVMINMLEDKISSLPENAEFNFSDEEAVRSGIEDIGKKLNFFMKSIEDLVTQANKCRRDIERARTGLLK